MRKASFLFGPIFLSLVLFTPIATAQHVQILSDQQWIELGIDLLRKGIQEEDTMKINMVLAPEVSVDGDKVVASAEITQRFQTLFDGGSNRTMRLAKPAFSRPDSPRHNSDFWDFDILDPKITISGDSAVVECELVLWGAPPDGVNRGPGGKVSEKLIFIQAPPATSSTGSQLPQLVETEDGTILTIESRPWPDAPFKHDPKNSRRAWKLTSVESVFPFCEKETIKAVSTSSRTK